MQKTTTLLAEIKLVGITARTNNAHIFEGDPSTNIIAVTVQKYFYNGLAEKINGRKILVQLSVLIRITKVILTEITHIL